MNNWWPWARSADAAAQHARFLDLISARLDAPLSPPDERALRAHLSTCASCAERAADLSRLRALAAALPTLQPRRSFALSRRDAERARGRRWSTPFARAGLAAAMAGAVALGLGGPLTTPPAADEALGVFESGGNSVIGAIDPDPAVPVAPAAVAVEAPRRVRPPATNPAQPPSLVMLPVLPGFLTLTTPLPALPEPLRSSARAGGASLLGLGVALLGAAVWRRRR